MGRHMLVRCAAPTGRSSPVGLREGIRKMRFVQGIVGVAALIALAGGANATIVDLTTPMSSGVVNGARFETADFRAAGTGLIHSFVRVQASGTEQGYNTSGRPVAFDENTSPNYTRNLTYADIPTRVIGGVTY